MAHDTAAAFLKSLERFPIQETTVTLVHSAAAASARWNISYWDAAIIEAARALSCQVVWSEDLGHGQDYGGVRVENPFV